MRAWLKRGDELALAEVPEPAPGADELLIRVRAVSLNRGELRAVARAGEGRIPGWDVCGTVVGQAASGSGPREGTRVAALLDGGGWAELAAVPLSRAALVPDGVADGVAATLPIAVLTVLRAFAVAGTLLTKRVLITGGSGGVGQFAIQLAAIGGAVATAVSSRRAQHEELRALGAQDVVTTIDEAAGRFDLVLESVGGTSLARAVDLLAPGGVVVSIGNSSEEATTLDARALYSKGGARIYGLLIFEELESRRIQARELEPVMALIRDGRVRAPIAVRRSWTELPAAMRQLELRAYTGKAVLELP